MSQEFKYYKEEVNINDTQKIMVILYRTDGTNWWNRFPDERNWLSIDPGRYNTPLRVINEELIEITKAEAFIEII